MSGSLVQAGRRTSPVRKLRKRLRQGYVRLLRSPGAPSEIAGGLAVGLFLSLLPIIQTPVAVGVTEALRRGLRVRLSRLAAVAGVFLTNPLTGPVLYGSAFLVGHPIARFFLPAGSLGVGDLPASLGTLALTGGFALEVLVSLLIGGVLLGIPIAVAGFFVTRALVRRYQARVRRRFPRDLAPAITRALPPTSARY